MSALPFAGFNPKPTAWGYNWTNEGTKTPEPVKNTPTARQVNSASSSPEPQMLANQYANMPAALLNSLKRDKKPFTYTPGGVNLSEVLNARLQKRLERKKRYIEEKLAEEESKQQTLPTFEPPKQVIVMPTYNSPLDMYSMENALEALEVQAELAAADKSLSSPSRSATLPRNHTFRFEEKDLDSGRGVAQSKAFRVLQIITDTEEAQPSDKSRPQHQDEMRFTGIRDSKTIPSKFFHTLQKITGTEDDEEEEQKHTKDMHQAAAPRTTVYEKQPTSAVRAPQQNPPYPQPVSNSNLNPKFASQSVQQQQSFGSTNPALKRPAAFLPIKTTPGCGFRPVQAPCLSNGPIGRGGNFSAGTDF